MPPGNLRARHLVPSTVLSAAGAAPLQALTCLVAILPNAGGVSDIALVVDKKFTILDCVASQGAIAAGGAAIVALSTTAAKANPITNDMDIGTAAAAGATARATTVNAPLAVIAAGGTLYIYRTFNTNNGCRVIITGIYTA